VASTRPNATASTAAHHSGRLSHQASVNRTGDGTPIAIAAAHSANAVRCQAYTPIAASPARSHRRRQRRPTRSSHRAANSSTPTCASATTAVYSVGGVVFDRAPGTTSMSAAE
jgi:hypothetical protein